MGNAVRQIFRLRHEIPRRTIYKDDSQRENVCGLWRDRVREVVGHVADASAGESAKTWGASATISFEAGNSSSGSEVCTRYFWYLSGLVTKDGESTHKVNLRGRVEWECLENPTTFRPVVRIVETQGPTRARGGDGGSAVWFSYLGTSSRSLRVIVDNTPPAPTSGYRTPPSTRHVSTTIVCPKHSRRPGANVWQR